MIAMLARLFVLRPLLGVAVLGIPVLGLIAIGLAAVVVFKVLFFVVLPIVLVVWILRKVLAPLSPIDSLELLVSKLGATKSNKDFLKSMEMGHDR